MTTAYFASLVALPTLIFQPGQYRTRCGETVTVDVASPRHRFTCAGVYSDGTPEWWHKTGRLFAHRETQNDIVEGPL
jgi:hypothetical protein